MKNREQILHRCANCTRLNTDDLHVDRYEGGQFAWCDAFECYVWVKGTCVGSRKDEKNS